MNKKPKMNKDRATAHRELAFDGAAAEGSHGNRSANVGMKYENGQGPKIGLAAYSTKSTLAGALHVLVEDWPDYMKLQDLFFNARNNGCGIADICPPWKNKYGVWMMLYAQNKNEELGLDVYLALAASFGLQVSE